MEEQLIISEIDVERIRAERRINPFPANTTSVVDSPKPQEENTYPAMQRADCWLIREQR